MERACNTIVNARLFKIGSVPYAGLTVWHGYQLLKQLPRRARTEAAIRPASHCALPHALHDRQCR